MFHGLELTQEKLIIAGMPTKFKVPSSRASLVLVPSMFMKSVSLDYGAHGVLVVVDCTPIQIEKREGLVIGSRDRPRQSDDWVQEKITP